MNFSDPGAELVLHCCFAAVFVFVYFVLLILCSVVSPHSSL